MLAWLPALEGFDSRHLPSLGAYGDLDAGPLRRRAAAPRSRLAALLQLLAHVAQADAVVLDAELLVQHLALRT